MKMLVILMANVLGKKLIKKKKNLEWFLFANRFEQNNQIDSF